MVTATAADSGRRLHFRMRNSFIIALALMLPPVCFGGIETLLIEEQQGNCTIRISHDATPSSDIGTILFRSFTLVDGLQYPCHPAARQVTESLDKGIAEYRSRQNLKPATSIMVGRISRFPWVTAMWQARSESGSYRKLSISDFNALIGARDISGPFVTALSRNGLELESASCEKLQFYDNGYPMDALCWLTIKPAR